MCYTRLALYSLFCEALYKACLDIARFLSFYIELQELMQNKHVAQAASCEMR